MKRLPEKTIVATGPILLDELAVVQGGADKAKSVREPKGPFHEAKRGRRIDPPKQAPVPTDK
jgi:hypothetical protein